MNVNMMLCSNSLSFVLTVSLTFFSISRRLKQTSSNKTRSLRWSVTHDSNDSAAAAVIDGVHESLFLIAALFMASICVNFHGRTRNAGEHDVASSNPNCSDATSFSNPNRYLCVPLAQLRLFYKRQDVLRGSIWKERFVRLTSEKMQHNVAFRLLKLQFAIQEPDTDHRGRLKEWLHMGNRLMLCNESKLTLKLEASRDIEDGTDKAWQASRNCFSKIYGDKSLFWKGFTITAWIVEDEGKYTR
ncbi:hypothetical protein LXL04_004654 [Taraxacum kok-saghyz]